MRFFASQGEEPSLVAAMAVEQSQGHIDGLWV